MSRVFKKPRQLAAARSKAVRIALYNHKGGVGKTTLTVNIAHALAEKGKRVLLVDSDPQCNLTAYLIESDVVDELLQHSDKDDGETLWSAVKPIVEASGPISKVEAYERGKNIYVLPGDIRLSEFESELSKLWTECLERKVRGYRGTTALGEVVNAVCEAEQIDYVFYDVGPNIGPLNRVILLDCDFFIVPAACDLFSIRALKTLGHTLSNWISSWQTIVSLAPDDVPLLPGRPKFLGFIPQGFRTYGGEISNGFMSYVSKIEKQIGADIITVLRRIDPELVPFPQSSSRLGQVKTFGPGAPQSQARGEPIWKVTAISQAQRDEAMTAFKEIASKIIQRTSR